MGSALHEENGMGFSSFLLNWRKNKMINKTWLDEKLIIKLLKDRLFFLEKECKKQEEHIKNAYRKFGRIFQMYAPFTNKFSKEERENFVFINSIIDGIIFGKNEITFVEIKTNGAILSENQQRVKQQIEQGKIKFLEVRYS